MSGLTIGDVTINIEDLTFGDLIDIQRATGQKVTRETLADPGIEVVVAMLWVLQRRENPALTFEEVCKTPISAIEDARPKG